ncbi:Peptidyl-prolyl cis-trans isomerase PASTICCINO1 [Sesamum angolense]|uniref:peptidylprolyl isomerase n=1 Tax=Sesamum angolense TaxID=2727404 RepID=A0AAE2BSJ1_9LAMI|nr:Peptidyl-prolyl cis-trans isomerase PASTICCINO1 [Sesamum angolense]
MAVVEDSEEEFKPQKKKPASEDDKRQRPFFRRKKMTPGSLMKALIRPGAGEKTPTDGDQFHELDLNVILADVCAVLLQRSNDRKWHPKREVLGKSKMILGLLEGIPTMLNGEVAMVSLELALVEEIFSSCHMRELSRKPELHYGEEDCPVSVADSFPKDDELHFEIELIDFSKVISEDLGIIKKVKEEGQGWEQPREPYEVKAWISGKSADGKIIFSHTQGEPFFFTFGKSEVRDVLGDGRLINAVSVMEEVSLNFCSGMLLNEEKTVFYDTRVDNNGQPLEFRSGEGLVPEGFEMCARLMLPGEIALVTCPPDYAYDKFPRPDKVPQGAHIQWEIELLDYEKQKDWTGFNFREIMDDVEKIKGTGNRLFKEGKYELAKAKYEHVLREFNHVNPQNDEEGKEFSDTRNLLHLNVAACLQKMGEFKKSIEACNKVLDTNPVHVKALYRRGMAYMGGGDFEEARADFNKMMTIDKSSESTAKAALLKLKKEEQEIHRRARQQFKGLFDKKPGEIAEAGGRDVGEKEPDQSHDRDALDGEKEHLLEATAPPPARTSLWSRLWPSGRRLFTSLGLDRCTIL